MSSRLAIVILAACGNGSTPPKDKEAVPAPAPPQPSPPPVVAVDAAPKLATCLKDGSILAEERVVGTTVVACYQDGAGCWAFDPATGSAEPRAALPAIVPQDPEVTIDPTGIKVCAAGGTDCKTIATKDLPDGATGVASSDRSLVAVAVTKSVTVYDVAKGTKLASIAGWKTPMTENTSGYQFAPMAFLGDNLVVWESFSPISLAAKLFVPRTGKLVADIGGPNVQISDHPPVHVDGATWAFVGFEYNLVYVQDLATGKLVAKYDLGKIETGAPDAWLGRVGDTFIVGSDKLRAIDTRTKATRTFEPPRCP